MDRIYLDWAATAPVDITVQRSAIEESFVYPGNPSSQYMEGKRARKRLEEIREEIGYLLQWPSRGIYFTSGGTESNNIVISSFLTRNAKKKLMCTAIEHPSVLFPMQVHSDLFTHVIQPDSNGIVPVGRMLEHANETRFAAVMAVNNDVGSIQEYDKLAVSKPEGLHLHVDIVQGLGKIPLSLTGLDSASISAHKLGGPKGCGILLLNRDITPLYRGGGQENGIRPGTESIFHALCLLEAIRQSLSDLNENMLHGHYLKNYLVEELGKMSEVKLLPEKEDLLSDKYSPFILRMSVPPMPGEVIVRILDDNGIAVSTGSACSNRNKTSADVLVAMGVTPEIAASAIRISWGKSTRITEMQQFVKIVREKLIPAVRELA